jgi:hypothetical protein
MSYDLRPRISCLRPEDERRRHDWNVDFDRINRALRSDRWVLERVLNELAPGGEIEGDKLIVVREGPPRSLQHFDLATGHWVDYIALGDGCDVIGFIARTRSLSEREAAQLIAAATGSGWRKYPLP